jgi:hypothetical protein
MANIFTYKVLKDTNQKSVIKLTGFFSGSDGNESNTARIDASSLYGALDSSRANLLSSVGNTGPLPYYGLGIEKIWWTTNIPGDITLYWRADTNVPLFRLNGTGVYNDNGNMITISNEAQGTSGANGDIGLVTYGATANSSYTIILELRKDNYDYSRGQDKDPAAFNYTPYNIKP